MSKQVRSVAAFVINDYASCAAAREAIGSGVAGMLVFLESEGAWGEDKVKAAKAAAAYREARLCFIADNRDRRHAALPSSEANDPLVALGKERTALRSLALDSAGVRELPANDPLKTERAAVQNAARVDWKWVQDQWTARCKAAEAAKSGDAKAGDGVKDPIETFKDFSKTMTSRNARGQWIDAGSMSLFLEKCRKELATMLEGRMEV